MSVEVDMGTYEGDGRRRRDGRAVQRSKVRIVTNVPTIAEMRKYGPGNKQVQKILTGIRLTPRLDLQ